MYLSPLMLALFQDAPPAGEESGKMPFWIPMLLIGAIFYFVMILPQNKQRKKREAMLGGMKKGDEVMTSSGIYGRIVMVKDDVITLQVADGVRMRFNRAAIQDILNKEEKGKADEESA